MDSCCALRLRLSSGAAASRDSPRRAMKTDVKLARERGHKEREGIRRAQAGWAPRFGPSLNKEIFEFTLR
eukprot:9487129-Pyramimonas_sp.AAC.4